MVLHTQTVNQQGRLLLGLSKLVTLIYFTSTQAVVMVVALLEMEYLVFAHFPQNGSRLLVVVVVQLKVIATLSP